jgi:hypothetical protein
VSDLRGYHTLSYAGQASHHQNGQHGFMDAFCGELGGTDALGQHEFGGKTSGMHANSPREFMNEDERNKFNGSSDVSFQTYLPELSKTPWNSKPDPAKVSSISKLTI